MKRYFIKKSLWCVGYDSNWRQIYLLPTIEINRGLRSIYFAWLAFDIYITF